MDWYVELTYTDGGTERMYCVTREVARQRRSYFAGWLTVTKAVVRKSNA